MGWQDALVPFCSLEQFPGDTLFLVFEEDFRFERPEEEFKSAEDLQASRSKLPANVALDFARTLDEFPPPEQQRLDHGIFQNIRKQPAKVWEAGVSDYLLDCVRLATAAHRAKRGDIMWCGWVPGHPGSKPDRPCSIGFGSHFLMVSKTGMLRLGADFLEHDSLKLPGHIDLALKQYLIQCSKDVGGSYFWPAIGNYTAHVSGCSRKHFDSVRPHGWDDKWTRQGTRKAHDLEDRQTWLCGWQAKGAVEWLKQLRIENGEYDEWRSFWGLDVPFEEYVATAHDGSATAGACEPAASSTGDSVGDGKEPAGKTTKRDKRRLRSLKLSLRKFRIWVDAEAEAGTSLTSTMLMHDPRTLFVGGPPHIGKPEELVSHWRLKTTFNMQNGVDHA